ncbi:hypothetical protein BaRGS_00018369 [Batillaria attramentaria]|uniref:Uncharacterized protein n=1 Tax=Batillaria attramentaria TaxID=370345 RepID=A0ABD0KU74_9CAEN
MKVLVWHNIAGFVGEGKTMKVLVWHNIAGFVGEAKTMKVLEWHYTGGFGSEGQDDEGGFVDEARTTKALVWRYVGGFVGEEKTMHNVLLSTREDYFQGEIINTFLTSASKFRDHAGTCTLTLFAQTKDV